LGENATASTVGAHIRSWWQWITDYRGFKGGGCQCAQLQEARWKGILVAYWPRASRMAVDVKVKLGAMGGDPKGC
jgi:hypothetical protein